MNNPTADEMTNAGFHPAIVDEHRMLAEKIDSVSHELDKLFSALARKSQYDVSRIIALLEDLRNTAQAHFQHEEALMIKNDFPGLNFHTRDHDYLITNLIQYTSSLSHGAVPFSHDIGEDLRNWLTYHLKKYDEAYVTFLESGAVEARD